MAFWVWLSSVPFGFFQMNYEWKDILTRYQGKHNLKAGVEFRRGHDDFFSVSKPSYTFQNVLDLAVDKPVYESLSVGPKTGLAKGANYQERTSTRGDPLGRSGTLGWHWRQYASGD